LGSARRRLVLAEGALNRIGDSDLASHSSGDLSFRGDLQAELMGIVWRLGEATVDQVREQQPGAGRSAYNTVQTVLNRLVERGLLLRARQGRAFAYRPAMDEAEYLHRSIGERLANATPEARRAALTSLVGELDATDVDDLARRVDRIRRARRKG
jgi:predicted transcriptional regulator